MILQEKMPLWRFTEFVPDLILADGDEISECLRAAFVFQHLYAIEIMLHMIIGIDDDPAGIPLSHGVDESSLLVRGDQVV